MRNKRPLLALKDYRILLKAIYRMPHPFRNVYPILTLFGAKHHVLDNRAIIPMSRHTHLPSQNHKGLILRGMSVYRNFSSRLHRIQATDGAARAELCSHKLCRVVTEVEHSSKVA